MTTETYESVKFTLDLPPTNVLLKDAVVNMMVNHPDDWKELIYGKLMAGDLTRTQSLVFGSNEDMIVMIMLTARYNLVVHEDDYALLVTDQYGIYNGVASISKCSNDALFVFKREEEGYSCRMLNGTCSPYADFQVAIELDKDDNGGWCINTVISNLWIHNTTVHPKITIVTEDKIRAFLQSLEVDTDTVSTHVFTKDQVLKIGIQNVDATSIGAQ